MLLLNHTYLSVSAPEYFNLHFNMLLLNRELIKLAVPYALNLHFNMLLLNHNPAPSSQSRTGVFTFQYASIKPMSGCGQAVMTSLFTFQYASIKPVR